MTIRSKEQKINHICYLFLIFLIGCLAGWVYEEVFYWITEGLLRNRGVLYGPWLPIYGIGTLGIYAMKPFKKNPVVLFVLCAGITGIVECLIGLMSIYCFGLHLWDYHGEFGNIGGIVCLRSVASFGVLGLIFHLVEPVVRRTVNKLNRKIVYGVCLVLACLFLLDCILSILFRTPITY